MNNRDATPSGAASSPQVLADRIREDYRSGSSGAAELRAWERSSCRACGAADLQEVLSLGDLPPANAYVRASELEAPELRFPLSLRLCEACGMVQLGHVVPADLLFRSYLFFTSSSQRMSEHFSLLMTDNANEFVHPGGLVVEIGSNDGTALAAIQRRDVRVLGVDPSRNISVIAASRGVPTIAEFFTEALADEILRVAGPAELIVGCNVLGHIDDLDDVCRGLKVLLAENGAFVFEVPYLGEMLDRGEYDTIYHEHLSYFAVRSLAHLFDRNGLRLERVEFFPVHGGSLRGTVVRGDGTSGAVDGLINDEVSRGLGDRQHFAAFVRRVHELRASLRARLDQLHTDGIKVIGYGAPAKGSVVLNYCGIDAELLPLVIDSTPAKQGLYVPGTHQRIVPPSALEEEDPQVLLLLAWNHADEIIAREKDFRARGGRFLTPHLDSPI